MLGYNTDHGMLAVVISLYISYNKSIVGQNGINSTKGTRKISHNMQSISDNNLDVYLSNLGDQELKVRRIYLKNENISTFVGNPNK